MLFCFVVDWLVVNCKVVSLFIGYLLGVVFVCWLVCLLLCFFSFVFCLLSCPIIVNFEKFVKFKTVHKNFFYKVTLK